jgi:antitoxin VapB
MALSIRNKKAEALARDIARRNNITMTQAILESLEEKVRNSRGFPGEEAARLLEIREIGVRCAALPDLETRTADEILGYNDIGAF